jgi:replication fork protection complex subunit Csm3/Swi3
VYQLWLDDLYPRAKFADGLAIIEKLGHSRRMQTMRREWINEAKSKDYLANGSPSKTQALAVDEIGSDAPDNLSSLVRAQTPTANDEDEDQLYSATPRKAFDQQKTEHGMDMDESLFVSDDANEPPQSEDELDALLAEVDARGRTKHPDNPVEQDPQTKLKEMEPSFDDEMEAMAGMDDMW